MSTQHTPGPWRPFAQNGFVAVMQGKRSNREVIKWTGFDASDFPEHAIGNAWLIAAAPEMLAALKLVRSTTYQMHDEALRAVEAAIAKAEGR